MTELGFKKQIRKKGVYYDGHDREDVQLYLHKTFLPLLDSIEPRRTVYIGDGMDVAIPPENCNAVPIRVAYHDESIFYANDISDTYYGRDDDQELPKKGLGRCFHVSDFMFESCGFLNLEKVLTADQKLKLRKSGLLPQNLRSRVIICPGKNADAWWDCEQLLAQCKHTLDLFEIAYPGEIMCAIFDCSSNHQAFAHDALVVSRMNVNPGGKHPLMRDTFFISAHQRNQIDPTSVPQSMVFLNDYSHKQKDVACCTRTGASPRTSQMHWYL
eukprot:CRZ07171.1 hypothetical protein [Spongospora subterranea]